MRLTGKVKRFNSEKGYGFIKLKDGRDVFFHYSQLRMKGYKTIMSGAKVKFDLIETDRGLQAQNIEVINESRESCDYMSEIPF